MHVFTYRGNPVTKMYNRTWKRAREKVGIKAVRIHDLNHPFGRRLRVPSVPLEKWELLPGHKSDDIATHYSGPELGELLEATNRVCVA